MNGNAEFPGVTLDDIRRVPNPTPAFWSWMWDAFANGRLDIAVQAALSAGQATGVESALSFLQELGSRCQGEPSAVHVADIQRKRHSSRHTSTLQKMLGAPTWAKDPQLILGARGHAVASALLRGAYDSHRSSSKHYKGPAGQLSLFPPFVDVPPGGQTRLFSGPASYSEPRNPQGVRRASYPVLIHRIEKHWDVIRRLIENGDLNAWRTRKGVVHRLEQAIEQIVGDPINKLWREGWDPSGNLVVLTILSWAAMIISRGLQRIPHALFTEIGVLGQQHGLGGGRIDAIEVTSINGKNPTPYQQRLLGILSKGHYRSTGHLMRVLLGNFRNPEIVVIDWKFLVGDMMSRGSQPDLRALCASPLSHHEDQMRRYLTLIQLDYHLTIRHPELWQTNEFSLHGELHYIFPHCKPVVHNVSMTPQELEQWFANSVALRWSAVQRRAIVRVVDNFIMGTLVGLLNGRPRKRNGTLHNGEAGEQIELIPAEPRVTAATIVERTQDSHRRFVDEHQIIEIVEERPSGQVIEMRLDRLMECVSQGSVSTFGFSAARGGKIQCLMPGHRDSTFSLQVYLADFRPHFHCFGCGAHGKIASESISREFALAFIANHQTDARTIQPVTSSRLPVIPEEHHRIMSCAQKLLSGNFWNSEGERYLVQTRKLDVQLAFEKGAGYADSRFICALLEEGLTVDELIVYGFVGISRSVSSRHGLAPLLFDRGFKLNEIKRPLPGSTSGKPIWGMPYSTLNNRVTFPLTLEGRVTNIYGRAAYRCDRRFSHRKLSTEKTKVPQGGFHMEALEGEEGEVVISEGAIDALSLIELGWPRSLAMIGVSNTAIIRVMARSQRNFAIALDNDDTGRRETAKLVERLRGFGWKGQSRDFTGEFVRQHHDRQFKDYNDWLIATRLPAPDDDPPF